MPPAAHGRQQSLSACEIDRCGDIRRPGATRNEGRPAIESAVPDRPSGVVTWFTRPQQLTAKTLAEILNVIGFQRQLSSVQAVAGTSLSGAASRRP